MISVHLYLDKRNPRQDGTAPVKISVHVNKTTALLQTDVYIAPADWSPVTRQVIHLPNRAVINKRLDALRVRVYDAVMDLAAGGMFRNVTPGRLRDMIEAAISPDAGDVKTFASVYREFIDRHENERTRNIYQTTLNVLAKYDRHIESRVFEEIDKRYLERFYTWAAKTAPSVNARNIHLRNIRAVFNYAIDDEITTAYPFRKLKIKPEQTRKRSLTADEIRSIITAEVPAWAQKYVDAFALSFFLIGANIVDLCGLQPGDVSGGRVSYKRAKTRRLYDIRIEPEAAAIMDRYHGKKSLLGWADGCKSYRSFAMKENLYLQKIRPGLTTYYARHSWATIAASLDIPKETIAAALGHGGRTVTDIYISFDRRKVDEANRRVIDAVFSSVEKL